MQFISAVSESTCLPVFTISLFIVLVRALLCKAEFYASKFTKVWLVPELLREEVKINALAPDARAQIDIFP